MFGIVRPQVLKPSIDFADVSICWVSKERSHPNGAAGLISVGLLGKRSRPIPWYMAVEPNCIHASITLAGKPR